MITSRGEMGPDDLMDRDYVGISLWVTSDHLTVDMISQTIGQDASYSQSRGDLIANTKRRYERHAWNLSERIYLRHADNVSDFAEGLFNAFLQRLQLATLAIRELSRDNTVTVEVIYSCRSMPFVGLTKEQIQGIAAIGANLTFDILVAGDGKEE